MGQLRRDPIVGRWVIVNVEDSLPPQNFEKEVRVVKQLSKCQFCPGKEHLTPPEVDAVRPAHSAANTPGWSVRVVPNKFPALRIEGEIDRRGMGVFDFSNGIGAHEVLIETADHVRDMADYSNEEMLHVIRMYMSRSVSLARDKRFKYVLIFKNFGQSAGASVEHPHSQVIALPMIPKYVLEEMEGAARYYEYRDRCIFCDMIQQEFQEKERLVAHNEGFVAFCPFVPRYPFEVWIAPRRHQAFFTEMSNDDQFHLAAVLRETMYRIKMTLGHPAYNFFLHTAPVHYEGAESFHWHIEIIPKLTHIAGFEWGSGFYVVQTAPDVAARHLAAVKV